MNKTSLILIILIVLLLGLGIFLGRNDAQTVSEQNEDITGEVDETYRKFNVQHSYDDGVHAFAGIVNTPTECHAVIPSSSEDEDGVMLMIEVTDNNEGCTEVITPKSFLYQVEGGELVNPLGKVNDEIVEINLFPRESVDDIDLSQFESKG